MKTKKLTNSDVYAMANEAILKALENGVNPWKKTWESLSTYGVPINLVNKKPYRGFNTIILGMQNVPCQCWVTYRQAKQLGGNVKKGAGSSIVTYWKILDVEKMNEETGELELKQVFFLRYYRVFNALRDCEGLEDRVKKITGNGKDKEKEEKEPFANPDEVLLAWMQNEGIPLNHGGDSAHYSPQHDCIQMPFESDFIDREHYIQVLAHECIHSTGHQTRLARPGIVNFDHFGSEQYSFEELIAETGSTYLSVSLGYEPDWNNTAAYLNGWKKKLKANPDWFIKAAGRAEKASDFIIQGRSLEKEEKASQVA